MKSINYLLLISILTLSFTSCSDDDDNKKEPEVINEEEVITDVTLTFTDQDGNAETYTYTNPLYRTDDYTEPTIQLTSGETYQVAANFYNNSDPNDPEVVTEEIKEEKDDHFLEYAFVGPNVDLTRTDGNVSTDSNGIKIGLNTQWVAGDASEGTVQVTLIHQPETKNTSNPNGDHTGGETDAQVEYNVVIE